MEDLPSDRPLVRSRGDHQCRICLQNQENEQTINPCMCKGSIQFVHISCMKEYFRHRFKTAKSAERKIMKQHILCQICKGEIKQLKIKTQKRCATCKQMKEQSQLEDLLFIVVFVFLYIGFHAIGIVIIIQDSVVAKVIGSFWLFATIIGFNYGLFKIIKNFCYVSQPILKQVSV